MPIKAMAESSTRGAFDDISTPNGVIDFLLPYIPAGTILEGAPGEGKLLWQLLEAGREVVPMRGDFLLDIPPVGWDVLVTNPPFSQKRKWLKRANELNMPWFAVAWFTRGFPLPCQLNFYGVGAA